MQVAKVAEKLRAQIEQFAGIFYPRFSKHKLRFIEQMLFGIAASQDCKLSQISRALREPISLKKTRSGSHIIWQSRSWEPEYRSKCSRRRPGGSARRP